MQEFYASEEYPSSVNRGYFSYLTALGFGTAAVSCIHPLSIEAISPTYFTFGNTASATLVSILCQSRLFLLRLEDKYPGQQAPGIHPLSIEAISPTWKEVDDLAVRTGYPSSVNRGYFSYKALPLG